MKEVFVNEENKFFSAPTPYEFVNSSGKLLKFLYDSSMTEYVISDNVLYIGTSAFPSSTLNRLVIHKNLISMDQQA